MGYLKSVGTAFIYISLFLAVITFMPGLPPDTEFQEYSVTPARDLDVKNRLNGAEWLFKGEIDSPEDFDSYNGQLYTTVHGGYVLRIEEDRTVPIVKFGEKCDGIWQEHKCGRPLGLRFDKKGNLFVVDTYYGIFKVNVTTGEYENIVNISKPIDGKFARVPNSIAIAENGDLYWSDSSTDFALYDIMMIMLSDPSGRLIRYNAAKKKNEVLMQNLALANGLALSDDESFILVAESLKGRIIKYNLKGPKAGQHEVLIDGLPGLPDNFNSDGQGGFFLSLIFATDSEHPELSQSLAPHPYLRKMLTRLLVTMELPFKLLQDIFPKCPYIQKILHAIGSFQGFKYIIDPTEKSMMLRLDASGNIIEALSSDDGSNQHASSAHIHNDFLWLGSPWVDSLRRIPLKQVFPDLADSTKQSRTRNGLPNDAASDVKMERAKRNTDSTTKPIESDKVSQTTATPTTTPKPTAAPTTPKSTAAPKSSTSKADKSSETKSSANAEDKKDNAKTVDAKSEENSKKDDAANAQSGKNVRVEQDASVKQTAQESQPEKAKRVETNRPRDDL